MSCSNKLVKDHNLKLDIHFFYRNNLYVGVCVEDRNLMSMRPGRRYLITDGPESVFRDYGVLFHEPFEKKTTSSISFGANNLKSLRTVIGWLVLKDKALILPVIETNENRQLGVYNYYTAETYRLCDDKYIKNPPDKRMTMTAFSKELSDAITASGRDCMRELMSKYDLSDLCVEATGGMDMDQLLLIL